VNLRLRSDVPVGAFLSGGLDSSAVVATLAHLGAINIRTFSVGFRGDPASELPAAAATAKALGTIHTELELVSDELIEYLPMLSRHRGAPVAETADLPIYLMSVEAAKSVKVVLSGEGSDEIFAGYPKHLAEYYLGDLASSGLFSQVGWVLNRVDDLLPTSARRIKIAARAMRHQDFGDRMIGWFGAFSVREREELWTGPRVNSRCIHIPYHVAPGTTRLRHALHFDQTSWLPDNLLERLDRMTMAASIEARNPFMDVRLAEFASSLPDKWLIKGLVTKRIVREALASRLPKAVLERPKNGFRMPVTQWFRGPLIRPFRDLVLSEDAICRDYLDVSKIRLMLDEHIEGRKNYDKILWTLFSLEIFLREFF
jgi:asparagine synthase (glutamine-hydrolysing)